MNQAIPDVSVSPPGDSVAAGLSGTADQPAPSNGANGSGGSEGGTVDRFTIIRQIGQGGMGHVYLARHPVTDTEVALKCLKPELVGNAKAVKRFLAEARHMYHLNHPHVLRIMEVGEGPRGPYYVMPYLPAGALASSITRGTAADPARTLAIAREVADALAYAHSRGILHRDLKPANVLLDEAGHACLGDFGMVHDFTTNDSVADPRVSYCEGTVAYMSPAVARGEAEDTRCDIYAFGAMLCELLTGEVPYAAPTVRLTLDLIAEGTPVNILQRNPAAPRGLARIAEGCMARELRDRYARMSDVVADVERVAKGQRPLGPHGTWGRTPRWGALAALAAALLVAASLVATIGPHFNRKGGGPGGLGAASLPPATRPVVVQPRTVDLMPLIDPALDATPATAVLAPGGIRLARPNERTYFVFPYEPPDEYDLTIDFVRAAGTNGLDHCIVHGDTSVIWTLGGLGNDVSCLWPIGSAGFGMEPGATRHAAGFSNNEPHQSKVSVRDDSITTYLDGKLVLAYKTNYQNVHFPRDEDGYLDAWGRRLGVAGLDTDFLISAVRVTEISGPGRVFPHRPSDPQLVWAGRAGMPRPYDVRFVRDGALLACATSPHQHRHASVVWNPDGVQRNEFGARWVVPSFDGRRLARAWDGGTLNVAGTYELFGKDFGSTSQDVRAAFSVDGGHIAHVGKPELSTVHVISASDGAAIADLEVPNAAWVGFSPDREGQYVAAIGSREGTGFVSLQRSDGTDAVWTADLPAKAGRSAASAPSAEFDRDGKRLLVSTGTWVVCLSTDADENRKPRERIELRHPAEVVSAHFSADGRYVIAATARPASSLRLWDLTAPQAPVTRFTRESAGIGAMELSPDGRWLAVGDERGDIRLIDFATGQQLATLTGHDGPVISIAISPDGKNIASGSEDGVVRMFKVPDAVTAGGK